MGLASELRWGNHLLDAQKEGLKRISEIAFECIDTLAFQCVYHIVRKRAFKSTLGRIVSIDHYQHAFEDPIQGVLKSVLHHVPTNAANTSNPIQDTITNVFKSIVGFFRRLPTHTFANAIERVDDHAPAHAVERVNGHAPAHPLNNVADLADGILRFALQVHVEDPGHDACEAHYSEGHDNAHRRGCEAAVVHAGKVILGE